MIPGAFASLVFAPPQRLYYVRHTIRHLQERGFPEVMWLRTPDASEISHLDPEQQARRRVMIVFYTTILPTVRRITATRKLNGVFVFEDTCILTAGVTYSVVQARLQGCKAGVFGYGDYRKSGSRVNWFGTKGIFFDISLVRKDDAEDAEHARQAFRAFRQLACSKNP